MTPSGTNNVHGSASYRFKRNGFSTDAFFLPAGARKPDTEADDFTAAIGGPIQKDRWHFYGAYEYVDRSLVTGGQVITVTPANADALGITLPADGVIPAHQKVNFLFGKSDYKVNDRNQLSARYFLFKNFSPANIAGGLTTTDRATDFTDRMGERDPRYVDLVRSQDPFPYNAGSKTGILVEAHVGKGRWIYTGLGLWRQLPAGTDGAYRLLANVISLGKRPA